MTQKTEIWAIIKEVYRMSGMGGITDQQIQLVDTLERYMKGDYKAVVNYAALTEESNDVKKVVMITQSDGTQKPRGRGRAKKS